MFFFSFKCLSKTHLFTLTLAAESFQSNLLSISKAKDETMNAAREIMFLTLLILFITKGTSGNGGEYFHIKILIWFDIVRRYCYIFFTGRKLCEFMFTALYRVLLRKNYSKKKEYHPTGMLSFCNQSIDNRYTFKLEKC